MTAVEVMTIEVKKIQRQMNLCIDANDRVMPNQRKRYNQLVNKAREYRDSIDWMTKLYRKA